MADSKRSVNIELVSRSLFLQNIASVQKLRDEAAKRTAEFNAILVTGNPRKIVDAAVEMRDAENAVDGRVGLCNRHFRKAVRAFQIHNGAEAALAVFEKVAEVFPDVPQTDTEKLSTYFAVLGENQDIE
jgi:hypothetical protein